MGHVISWLRNASGRWLRAVLVVLGAAAALIPPALVVYQNWLMHEPFYDVWYREWHASALFNRLSLPTYFLLIFPLFGIACIIFYTLARLDEQKSRDLLRAVSVWLPGETILPAWQGKASTALLVLAVAVLSLDVVYCVYRNSLPGIELLGIAGLYGLGLGLREAAFGDVWFRVKTNIGPFGAFAILYIAVLMVLQVFFGEHGFSPAIGLGLAAAILGVMFALGWLRRVPVVLWISLGAVVLYAWRIDSWRYSVVGDEYEFYSFAHQFLFRPPSDITRGFFNTSGVYGTHTVIVSLVQSAFIKVFGASNFGWRISNPVILSAAVVCFYAFLRKFVHRNVALLTAGLLGCSSYLMNFGKIGYDNPQALLMLGLTLWPAAEAASSRRATAYAGLGMAMGLCLYSYPTALYCLPLAILLLCFYDFPNSKAAAWRWVGWLGMFCLFILPLLFQPLYFQGKLEGIFLSNPDAIRDRGLGAMIGTNLVYSLFAYVYTIEESHFVSSSHIDPISAIWVPVGLGWLVAQTRRNKFAAFWMLGFVLMWVAAGASHGRQFPPNTRMFMLLPWWTFFAAIGINWLANWVRAKWKFRLPGSLFIGAVFLVILAANVAQVFWLFPQRSAGEPNLEVLFLRLTQHVDQKSTLEKPTYLFVTQEDWGIDGIRMLQGLYQSPESDDQLARLVMSTEKLDAEQTTSLNAANTIVIPQPWMNPEWQDALKPILLDAGKIPCEVRNTAKTDVRFTAYFPGELAYLCPVNGVWDDQ